MKDILVHLDGGDACDVRLRHAIHIAASFGATLTGLFAQADSDMAAVTARQPSRHLREAAARRAVDFNSRTAEAGVRGEWLELPHGDPGFVIAETVFSARYADLAILGQWDAESSRTPEDLVERTVLEAGRPVLIIPQSVDVPSFGARVGVAWNSSREAARALHDSLPFLARAKEVTVLTIRSGQSTPAPGLPHLDIVKHLANLGVAAKGERVVDEDIGRMDALLLQSFNFGFDMLVMGAQSGMGVVRGAGTRFMLRHMTLPVLMSC
jgi:nucleotide-binding universal stress UspA family protein